MRRTLAPIAVTAVTALVVIAVLLAGDQGDPAESAPCRSALLTDHERGATWWRTGQRPAPCAALTNTDFADVAADVTGDSSWGRCRSALHALLLDRRIWTERDAFPDVCSAHTQGEFAEITLQAWEWLTQDGLMDTYWTSVGTPTARPSNWRDLTEYQVSR